MLFNGTGVEAEATLEVHARDAVNYHVLNTSIPDREPPLRLTVGLALLRGERFEIAVQKLTELGVERIVPLAAERSVVSFDVAREWQRRHERYARIMREAAEQSERVTLVAIDPPVAPAEFFRQQPTIVLVERANALPIANIALRADMAVAIGPEGGWSQRELTEIDEAASEHGSLGTLIYRAETAAIVAAGTLIQRAWAEH
jgi:16S rRNA (uracil1498-N3)-methyltransferase